jgi:protein TonB
MDAEKKVRLCIVFVSVALHLVILFCVVFNVVAAEVRFDETAPLRIVDITEYVEAPPPPPPPVLRPRVALPKIEPMEVQEEIAETVVETNEDVVETAAETDEEIKDAAGETVGKPNYNTAPAASGQGPASNDAAAQYVKENYTYVQRRILQELVYPSKARRTGLQGVVEVIFTINANGDAGDISVRSSSGKEILDEEALRAVKSASPFRRPPAPVRIVIPVSFKLM